MRINLDTYFIQWNGSHYGRVFDYFGNEFDCFSFAWEKDKPSALDFTTAADAYII